MAKNVTAQQTPTHDEISARAHKIYETEGRPDGKAMQHWLQAEAQLINERKAQVNKPSAKPAPPGNMPAGKQPSSGASNSGNWPGNQRQPVSQN